MNHFLPPTLSEQATMRMQAKWSRRGIQSTPSDRKRTLPKTDLVIWASVAKRRSFSPTRNPTAVAAQASTRCFHEKNAGSRIKSV